MKWEGYGKEDEATWEPADQVPAELIEHYTTQTASPAAASGRGVPVVCKLELSSLQCTLCEISSASCTVAPCKTAAVNGQPPARTTP